MPAHRGVMSSVAVVIALVAAADAATPRGADDGEPRQDVLPLVGGPGGTSFAQVCPTGHLLTGIRARRSATIDAIGVRCRPVQANGDLGAEVDAGQVWGGPGGRSFVMSCGASAVIAEQVAHFDGTHLSALRYHCFRWDAGTRRWDRAGKRTVIVVLPANASAGPPPPSGTATMCPVSARPADGVRGRSAMIVDAVGIRCDAP